MSEWKEKKLYEVCQKITDGSHYSPVAVIKGYPMLSVKDMREYDFDFSSCKNISNEDFCKMRQNDCIPQVGDVLVAKDGSYLKEIFCCKEYRDIAILSSIAIFRPNQNIISPDFLCYLLKTPFIFNYISKNCVSGSALPRIVLKSFKDVCIPVPDLFTQSEIAGILSSLDAKIETNNKLNEKLEEMAQAIFKSWFVDFEPFKDKPFHETELGMIPEGWEVLSLTDIATFTNGLAMQKFRPNYKEPHLPVLKIKELRQGFCDDTSEICIDDISDDFIADDGDIIFSWSGTLLVDIWCGGKCGVNQHLFKVTSEKYSKWFFYFWIKRHLAEFIRIAKDKAVTMGHIKRGHLTNALVVVPNEKTMQNADKIFTPIIDKIIEAKIESKRLASLRDTLLPRLMSGELIV